MINRHIVDNKELWPAEVVELRLIEQFHKLL